MKFMRILAVVALLSMHSFAADEAEEKDAADGHGDEAKLEESTGRRVKKDSKKNDADAENKCTFGRDFAKGKATK